MAQLNASGRKDKGEVARVCWKYAQALEAVSPANDEAESYRQKAKDIRLEIQGARFDQQPDIDDTYDLLVPAQFRT